MSIPDCLMTLYMCIGFTLYDLLKQKCSQRVNE